MNNFDLNFGLHEINGTRVKDLPDDLVFACPSLRAAFRLAISQSLVKREDAAWAEKLGVTPGNFSNILNGDVNSSKRPRYIPDNWFTLIPLLTGNNAVAQWQALMCRRLVVQSEIEKKRKEVEAQQLELERLIKEVS